jgi:hypothetical protein
LEALGYRFLGDYKSIGITNAPNSVMARTMIRCMISADGETCAGTITISCPRLELRTMALGSVALADEMVEEVQSIVSP